MKRIHRITGLLLTVILICILPVTAEAACLVHTFDSGVVTLQPTCDTIGIITYTCTQCGYQYTEKIGNLGHHYVDGVCTVCGQCEGGLYDPESGSEEASTLEQVTLQHTAPVELTEAAETSDTADTAGSETAELTDDTTLEESVSGTNTTGRTLMIILGFCAIAAVLVRVDMGSRKSSKAASRNHRK